MFAYLSIRLYLLIGQEVEHVIFVLAEITFWSNRVNQAVYVTNFFLNKTHLA